MGLTKAQLEALNDSSFPNNNVGAITPEILRNYNDEVILNTVNQDVYTTDSASFDNRIDGLATTSSVNAVSTSVGLLQTFSGSQYKADSASFSSRILAVTGSGGNVDTSSLVTTASFNAYTQSTANTIATLATTASVTALSTSITVTNNTQTNLINGKLDTSSFNTFSSSVTNEITAIESFTASISTSVGLLQTFSGSQYKNDSSSFDNRINAITASGGGVSVGTFNSYTASQDFKNTTFATTGSNIFIAAQTINGDLSVSQSKLIRIGDNQSIGTPFGNSLVIDSQGGNLIRNSAGGGNIRLENSQGFIEVFSNTTVNISGSNTTIQNVDFIPFSSSLNSRINSITVDTSSLVTTSSFNAYTSSQDFKNTTFATTSSLSDLSASIFSTDGTQSSQINGKLDTSSFNTFSTSVDSRINAITGSSIDTSSFATTGSNTFVGNQTINGNVNITGSLTASGLKYPSVDNGEKSFIQTDGNGNLSLQYVDTIFEAFYAGESVPKGTPLYLSGSVGANPIARAADASNPNKMPVTLIANENLTATNIYEGIVLGLIEGIDLTGFTAGQTVYVAEGGGYSTSLPSGSNSITQVLGVITKGGSGGKGLVLNPGPAQVPGLIEGYAWVGNNLNQPVAVATSSFSGGTIDTASFATTGSNTFVGDQYVSNGVLQVATYPQTGKTWFAPTAIEAVGTASVAYEQFVDGGGYDAFNVITNINAGTEFRDLPSDTFVLNTWLAIPQNTGNNPAPQFKRGLGVTGSANFEELTGSLGAFSASISNRINNVSGSGGTIDTSSFATTGSNTFTGNQTIEGAIVSNPTTGLTELFSQAFVSGAVQSNITASNAATQSNLIFGGTPLSSTQTGSVIISGSNNILHNPFKTLNGAAAFTRGYVNGNNNYLTQIPQLHTQSLFNPTVQANIGTGLLTMNFITSSIAVPFVVNNNFSTTITLNHQSGTVQMQNNISNGIITSNQNGLTSGTVAATFNSNIVGGNGVALNHTSSSILTTTNILNGVTVNNNYFHTGSFNSLTLAANLTNGQGITINAGGSPSTNVARPIVGNLLGGSAITIQADSVGTDLGGLRNEIVYGYNLIVSGAQSTANTTNQGGAFFGRYNDINEGLADSGKTIFAVGTGTSTSNRKTALSIDSASVVSISGSLLVNGVAVGTVNTSSFATTGSNSFNGNQTITGSLIVTGSNLSINNNGEITASNILLTGFGTTNIQYNQPSTGSVNGQFATSYGKDSLQVYQYQGQPYAFNVNLTANQANAYTGSQFQWGLQLNGSNVSLPGGGGTYFAMVSGSTTGSAGDPGADKKGLDYLGTSMILDMYADTSFRSKVYVDKGMFVSQSVPGSQKAALTVDGTSAANNRAITATGSVDITGSLTLNGSSLFAPAYGSYTGSGISSGVLTTYNQEFASGVEIVSSSFVRVLQNGIYQVSAQANFDSAGSSDNVGIDLRKNGTIIPATQMNEYFSAGAAFGGISTTALVQLNAFEYIQVGINPADDGLSSARVSIVRIA